MNVGSLFAGIGGFDLGFERAGMRTLWQVEQSEFRRAVLARHFPDAERFADVRDVGADNLAPVDVICGGFPCQDISLAGNGAGIDGSRSGLWFELARIVGELGPRYAVVENVPALTARGLDRVLRDLAALGYDAEWDCLPASAFGAPHQRDRIWLIAYPNSDGVRLIAERNQREGWEVRAAIGGYAVAAHDGPNRPVADSARNAETGPASSAGSERQRVGTRRQSVGEAVAYPEGEPVRPGLRAAESRGQRRGRPGDGRSSGGALPDADSHRRSQGLREPAGRSERAGPRHAERSRQHPRSEDWAVEPSVGRVADGVPARVDRLSALGDALVPQIAEWIGRRILDHERGPDRGAAAMVSEAP